MTAKTKAIIAGAAAVIVLTGTVVLLATANREHEQSKASSLAAPPSQAPPSVSVVIPSDETVTTAEPSPSPSVEPVPDVLSADYFIPDLHRQYYFTYSFSGDEYEAYWSDDGDSYCARAVYTTDDSSAIDTFTITDDFVYWQMASSGSGAWYLDSGTRVLFAPVKQGESWENNWTARHKNGEIKTGYDKYTFTGWQDVTVCGELMTAACIHHESKITFYGDTRSVIRDELYVKNVGFIGTTEEIMLARIE
jgi:hypothetical protein